MKDTEGGGGERLDNFALSPLEKKNGIIILPRIHSGETGSPPLEKNAFAVREQNDKALIQRGMGNLF